LEKKRKNKDVEQEKLEISMEFIEKSWKSVLLMGW
jgi:hypothetical protein